MHGCARGHAEKCKIGSTPQNEWYFFSHKDRKYPTGSRTNRATSAGFWKATGRDKCIRNSFSKIGMRKTLVFYRGRAPHGQKSDWIMHEYRLEDSDNEPPPNEDGWVVCRVFKKKNLFKINGSTSSGEGGPNSNSCDPNNIFTHRNNAAAASSMNQYLLHHHHQNQHHPHEHADLNYSHSHGHNINIPVHDHYPQVDQPNYTNNHLKPLMMLTSSGANYDHHHHNLMPLPTTSTPPSDYDHPPPLMPLQVKQFMSRDVDCESTATPPPAVAANYEPGLECDQSSQSQPMNQWDPLVATTNPNPNPNPSQINHLSLRSEMDFWAYGK